MFPKINSQKYLKEKDENLEFYRVIEITETLKPGDHHCNYSHRSEKFKTMKLIALVGILGQVSLETLPHETYLFMT